MSAETGVVVPVRGFTTRIYVRRYKVECASQAIGTFVYGHKYPGRWYLKHGEADWLTS
jgi:hypothetical protein